MANRTRDYARIDKQNKSRVVTKSPPRPWLGISFVTAGLIGLFIFALSHLHNLPKPLHPTLPPMTKKDHVSETHQINKPRFEFYSILPQSEPETVATNEEQPTQKIKEPAKKYMLQVAALKNKAEVERLKEQLVLMGFKVLIQQFDNHGSIWNRISLGPYKTEAEAAQDQQKLKQSHFTSILRRPEG